MTVRKPAGVSWESFVERQIREAHARGDFDDLPGAGEPIPDLYRPYDELWWIRRKLRDEQLALPVASLAVRRELDTARERIAGARSEAAVRRIVDAINARIRAVDRTTTNGPSTFAPLDPDEVAADRRRSRGAHAPVR